MSKHTCRVCGATAGLPAHDESLVVHWFCGECVESGAAIAWLEAAAG